MWTVLGMIYILHFTLIRDHLRSIKNKKYTLPFHYTVHITRHTSRTGIIYEYQLISPDFESFDLASYRFSFVFFIHNF